MAYNDFFSIRSNKWDNRAAQWMGRHFYIILFEAFLAIIFICAFINALKIINVSFYIQKNNVTDQLLLTQSLNFHVDGHALVINFSGVANVINSNSRLRSTLKNIEFSLSKRRTDNKPQDN